MEISTPIVLQINPLYSYIRVVDPNYPCLREMWEYFDQVLSYPIEGSYFIKAQAASEDKKWMESWDGKKHLFSVKTGRFLTGLLPYIVSATELYGVPFTVEDTRPVYQATPINGLSPDLQSRYYQKDAVKAILKHKRGIIWARPRSGKTICEVMLHNGLGLAPHLSICQSLDIVYQTVDKFKKYLPGVSVGMIGDGKVDIQDVTISTIQSIASAYDFVYPHKRGERKEHPISQTVEKQAIINLVKSAKIVWIDESHHAMSDIYRAILEKEITSAEYIIGSSGTPYREDNTDKHIEGLLGPIIFEIDYATLIAGGFLLSPTIHLIELPEEVDTKNKSYQTIYKECVVENGTRNRIIKEVTIDLNNRKKSCMILVSSIRHGELLERLIPGSRFVHGTSKNRQQSWQELRDSKLLTIVTTLGDEGLDVANLDAVIIAAGGESAIDAYQRLRCMTPSPEDAPVKKTSAIVVDFLDPYKYLKKHSNKRKKLYKSEEPSFKVVIHKYPNKRSKD